MSLTPVVASTSNACVVTIAFTGDGENVNVLLLEWIKLLFVRIVVPFASQLIHLMGWTTVADPDESSVAAAVGNSSFDPLADCFASPFDEHPESNAAMTRRLTSSAVMNWSSSAL